MTKTTVDVGETFFITLSAGTLIKSIAARLRCIKTFNPNDETRAALEKCHSPTKLPVILIEHLLENGFCLPEDYYDLNLELTEKGIEMTFGQHIATVETTH